LLNISDLDSRLKLPLRSAHPMRYLTRCRGLHSPAGAFSVKVEPAPECSVEEGNFVWRKGPDSDAAPPINREQASIDVTPYGRTGARQPDGDIRRTAQASLHRRGKNCSFVNVYLNDEDIRFLDKENTRTKDGDTISIVPSIAVDRLNRSNE